MKKIGNYYLPDEENQPHIIDAYLKGGWQTERLEAALKYSKKFDYAVDAGCHVGSRTITLAKNFKKVYGFEIYKPNFECLELNTKEYDNIKLYNIGLSDKIEKVNLGDDENYQNHTSGKAIRKRDNIEGNIDCITLDSLNLPGLDFYKLDVEGYEYFVLNGSLNTIDNFSPVIIFENKIRITKRWLEDVNAPSNFLKTLGYKLICNFGDDYVYSR